MAAIPNDAASKRTSPTGQALTFVQVNKVEGSLGRRKTLLNTMRILLVHNFYGCSAPSGENRLVLDERNLLCAAGHEVIEHFTYSDTVRGRGLLPLAAAALSVPWNAQERKNVRQLVVTCDPDVMHIHNVFPLLSPAIFDAASGTRTAVINTLHNYRTLCSGATPLRNGAVCTTCIERRSVWPALLHGCYRNSRIATIPIAGCVALHRGLKTYACHVDAFIALTQFQKALLVHGGLPEQNMFVKPNCFPDIAHPLPWHGREEKAVFIGRISDEKGVGSLVQAWIRWGAAAPKLEIIGAGPELAALRNTAQACGARQIVFVGQKSPEEARCLLSTAKLLIVPSECLETFGLVLCEAFAFGVPVAASRLGAFQELVETPGVGRLFTPRHPEDLQATVSTLWRDQDALEQMSRLAYQEFETKYSARRNVEALETIYKFAIGAKAARARMPMSRPEHLATQ